MMEVTEVKTKKMELEKELYRLITEFENESGTCVTELDMPTVYGYKEVSGGVGYFRGGKITVSVEVMS